MVKVNYTKQKQPSRGVLRKRCSENMQQIYRRTSMPKCEITLRHGCSPVNLLHIFRTPFLKVARMVNLELAFTNWIFYNLIILIKSCKIQYLNLDKALLFPRNQVLCLKNWKLWLAPTNTEFNFFCWNFAHVSYLTMSTKGCSGFLLFYLDLQLLITKNEKKTSL